MRLITRVLSIGLILLPLIAMAGEPAPDSDEDTFDLNVPDSAVVNPDTVSADENAGFTGNPMGDRMSW